MQNLLSNEGDNDNYSCQTSEHKCTMEYRQTQNEPQRDGARNVTANVTRMSESARNFPFARFLLWRFGGTFGIPFEFHLLNAIANLDEMLED